MTQGPGSGSGPGPTECTYSVSPLTVEHGISGGSGEINVAVTGDDCEWDASAPDLWITITGGASGTTSGTVTYKVAANTGGSRRGTMTVAGKSVTVRQEGTGVDPGDCTYNIDPSSKSYTYEGGSGSIWVTASEGSCPREAKANVNWLTVETGSIGTGSGFIGYKVSPNTAKASRTGSLTIGDKTFTVTQQGTAGTDCTFTFSPYELQAEADGGSETIWVSASLPTCSWTAVSNVSWMTVKLATGTGSGFLSFTVAANHGNASRTGTISIGGETLTVTQAGGSGQSCTYSFSPTSKAFDASGGKDSIFVIASSNTCTWSAVTSAGWITMSGGTGVTGSQFLSYTVSPNTGAGTRTGTITIAGTQVYTITQAGGSGTECTYSIQPALQSFDKDGGSAQILVTTSGSSCVWEATTQAGWITITSGATGMGTNWVSFSVTASTQSAARTGTIDVAGKTFTVTQDGLSGSGDDYGDSCAEASAANLDAQITGRIEEEGDVDFFKLVIETPGTLQLSVTGEVDAQATLYDSGCSTVKSLLVRADDGSIQETVEAGTYYAAVNASEGTGSYTLNVEFAEGVDQGDTCDDAAETRLDTKTIAALDPSGDLDFFELTLPSAGTLHIYTEGETDTFGSLYKGDDCTDAVKQDNRGNNPFDMEYAAEEGGTYYLSVAGGSSGKATGPYTLVVEFSKADTQDDESDDRDNAAVLELNSVGNTGSLDSKTDRDVFMISVNATGTLTLEGKGIVDTFGQLLGSDGYEIKSDDNGGTVKNFKIKRYVTAGDYYLAVTSATGGQGNYSVNVEFSEGIEDDYGDSCDEAESIALGTSTDGVLGTADDVDYFKVTVTKTGTLTVSSSGSAATDGKLLDSSCTSLAEDAAEGNLLLSESVTPGTYYIEVSGEASETGEYTLTVSFKESGTGPVDDDYTGWWYNPDKPGTGFSMDTGDEGVYMAWYVFDSAGKPIWYVSWARKGEGETYSGELYKYNGWPLGTAWAQPQQKTAGQVILDMSAYGTSGAGSIEWTLPGGETGTEDIVKYLDDTDPGTDDPLGVDGWWIDPAYPGMGFFIEAQGETLFICWFHFREDGSPRWWSFQSDVEPQKRSFTSLFQQYKDGTIIGGDWQPVQLDSEDNLGTFIIESTGDEIELTWNAAQKFSLVPYEVKMPPVPEPKDFTVTSSAFVEGAVIPQKYTSCDGAENVSPPLTWKNAPEGTQSFVAAMSGPDDDTGDGNWNFWFLYDIPVETTQLTLGEQSVGNFGINHFGDPEYKGPCPSASGTHNYTITVYALDTVLSPSGFVFWGRMQTLMEGHILAQTTLTGTLSGN